MNADPLADLPRAHGEPLGRLWLKSVPEDFVVEEVLSFTPEGEGEHVYLQVEKRGANTAWVATELAKRAGVAPMAVSFAGLKDRHAVTRQWFSVQVPGRELDPSALADLPGVTVLTQTRHRGKLRRGAIRANRFALRLRPIEDAPLPEAAALDARLALIRQFGVPNAYGEQRFGRSGDNVERARKVFAGLRVRREEYGILLSAARSEIFNQVLAERLRRDCWAQPLDGEVWALDGSHSIFGPVELDPVLLERHARHDIHPSGPLWGAGELRSAGSVRVIELAVAEAHTELCRGLEGARLEQERRALRLLPAELEGGLDGEGLWLRFGLPSGCYATVLLRELVLTEEPSRTG
ncbi:MAG: tRNA pseudouridine(13) synthase TruD [Xanthomonadales bacterium]|jgi:tRNA pseudouridine13 synthase|nr:tRNA pseudouridine(13) synthase TruD [Xanthomonadales bacterium]